MSRAEALPSSQSFERTAYSKSQTKLTLQWRRDLGYDERRRGSASQKASERYRGLTASFMRIVLLWAFATILTALSTVYARNKEILQFVGTIPMEGVEGRIDHMAARPDGRRLFVAALGSDMVEEIDTERRKVIGTIRGIKEPQGIYYIAKSKRLAVASGGDGNVRIYDQDSKPVGTVDSLEDANNVRYDSASNLLYVGYGQGALAIIDPDKAVK